jgi:hypothetical protein
MFVSPPLVARDFLERRFSLFVLCETRKNGIQEIF